MAAAEHGATFPKAKAIRRSMTPQQMHDFAATTNAQMAKPHPHRNLGAYLHPRKAR